MNKKNFQKIFKFEKMARSDREALKKLIVNYYLNIANKVKKDTVNHFKKEKVPESSIYSIISHYEKHKTTSDLPRSGRPQKLGPGEVKRLVKSFKNRDGKSQRLEAKKFNISQRSVSNSLKRNEIQYRKKEKAPLINANQREKIIMTCGKLATKTFI